MGLFFSKKRKEQEALLMATEEYIFRIEDITYLKNNLVSLGGRMLKGTICVGDKFIFNGVAYEIAGLMRGIEPNTEIAQNLYCGLVIHYKTTGIYKTIFKLGAVKIVKSNCLEKDNQAYEDCTLPTQSKTYICARCKKEITDEESKWIGNHRFCADCAAPPQKAAMESHLEAEAREAEHQAYMDFARGSLTPEQAYSNRGFVKDKDGKWVYGKLVTINDTVKPKEKPCEPIEIKNTIIKEIKPANGAAFSFEKTAIIIEIVQAEGKEFVRIIDYDCCSGANGRPLYSLFEYYYKTDDVELTNISATNYKSKIKGNAEYQYKEFDCGVIY